MAINVHTAAGQWCDRRTNQIDHEDIAQCGCAQAIRRSLEMERDIGEHRHLRKEHAEANDIGGEQPAVAKQTPHRRTPRIGRPATNHGLLTRHPHRQSRRGREIHHRKNDKRRLPAKRRGHQPRERASTEAARDRPRHVRRRSPAGEPDRILGVNVRNRNGEETRRRQPLHESPPDEGPETGRRRRQCRRRRKHEGGHHDDPLQASDVGQAPDHGRGNRDRQRRRHHRQAHCEVGRAEDPHQEREQWLRGIEVEKGRKPGKDDRKERRARGIHSRSPPLTAQETPKP